MCFAATCSRVYQERAVYSIYSDLLCGVEWGFGHSRIVYKNTKMSSFLYYFCVFLLAFFTKMNSIKKVYNLFHFLYMSLDLIRLFGSRCRTKLIEKFVIEEAVLQSKKGFYIRELCRDIDEQINSVRRELMNLENQGICTSYSENKKKYYVINRKCLIFPELSEIFLKTYSVLDPIKEFFKGRKGLDLVTVSE
jgi:hypothetical protein